MITRSDVAHSLAALSRRLEVHSTTLEQNSAYGACHISGSFCLRGGATALVYSPTCIDVLTEETMAVDDADVTVPLLPKN